jgi:hypothetical protein
MKDLDQKIIELMDLFDDEQVTTADKIDRPERALEKEAIDDFMKRNPMAGGGRINFYKGMSANRAPKKIKLKKPVTLTGKAGDRKLTAKQIDALDPNYLGDFEGGNLERAKKVYKSGTPGSVIDDAIEIRNIIVNNKGNIFGLEELGEKAEIFGEGSRKSGKGNRPDIRKVKAALEVAKDNFPEIANFKFVTDRYKIDGSQRQQLNMVVDTIKAYQNSTGNDKLANFLPENMGSYYTRVIEKGPKKLPGKPEQGLYIKMYNFGPEQIKYISDRITDETAQNFTSKDYKNLVTDVKKYRASVSSDKRQFTRAIEMNADIKKLYDDKVIQNLIRGDLDNKAKRQILNRAVNLLGDDVSVASKRLFMMAQSIAGTRPIDGIDVDKNLGKKIIDTQRLIGKTGNGYAFSGLVYDHYGKVIDQALNSPKGKSFIGYYQKEIRNALDKGLVPDEIFSVTASARRGLEPYAIFTQALDADVNSRIKGASLDSLLSTTHRNLQNIFQGKTYDKLNTAEKKAVQDLVTTYENAKKDVVKDLKPSIKKTIQLPEFDLKNPPSKSIANYASYDKNLQSAFDKSYKNVGYSMKVTKGMKTQKEFLDNLMLKLSAQIDPDCAQAVADGGRIGLKTVGSPDFCKTKARNYISQELINGIGTQQNAKTSLIKRIIAGSANFLKQNLSPKELLKMENLIGKPALYGAIGFETGLVADDVFRKGKPLNVAAAESLFGPVLNLDADAAKAKNILESNVQLSPAAKEYAQNIIDYDRYRKNQLSFPSSLVAKSMPGSDKYFKMQEDLKNKIMTTPDTGALDYQSALTESEAIFKAKPKTLFGLEIDSPDAPEVTPLTNRLARPSRTRGPMTTKQDMKVDLTPITYQNFQPNIPSKEELEEGLRKIGMIGQDEIITDEAYQQKFYRPEEFSQLFQLPSFTGANQRFEKGGRAGFKKGTPQSVLRKGILELIDDSVKKTPKDTTSTLDKLIKKTLDEDFFDKKDRIVDTLNVKAARERKNFPYNQQVQEEPSQLNFYDDIVQSDFKTKTGPFFDYQKRKNKAGGGILKQAGDSSGPPPESGPNSQGLQGLMKRGMKI